MNNPNIDSSGSLAKSLSRRGFPEDWLNRDIGELRQQWVPRFEIILQNVSISQEWKEYRRKVESLNNQIEKSELEEQRFKSEIEGLNKEGPELREKIKELDEQLRHTKALKNELDREIHSHEIWERNYQELMDAKKILEDKGFRFEY